MSRERSRAGLRLFVLPDKRGWLVRVDDEETLTSRHSTKATALSAARRMVELQGGEIRVHGRNGRVQESYTIGRESFARISAVEGIALTDSAKARSAEYDRLGLSSAERRLAVINEFKSRR